MLASWFVFPAVSLNLIGTAHYIAAVIRGTARPNKVSWLLWAVVPGIAFAAEVSEGVGLESVMTLVVGLAPLTVFLTSLAVPRSYWRLRASDFVCAGVSLAAVAAWRMTRDGNTAIVLSVIADAAAGLPTVRKAWRHPDSENALTFLLATGSAAITLLTVRTWGFANYGFPLYMLIASATLYVLIQFPLLRPLASRRGRQPGEHSDPATERP